uniref:MAM domain-containing glycosylphosphatidylinositol anchor protein 2-like n=1 Tax=Myxine glutinosa TaxID=7769 RepID=UPI00358E0AEE
MKMFLLLLLLARERNNAWAEDPENREQRGVVGGTTTLACQAPPEQQQEVDFEWWFKNETNVIIDYTNDVIDNEGNERLKFTGDLTKGDGSITIEDLRLSDSGVYTCEWTYYSGSGWVDNHILVNLTITARERNNAWAEDPENREQRGVVGGTTTLACQAPPEQQQEVDFEWWFKNETNVIIDYTNDVIDNEGNERVKFTGDLTKGDGSIIIEDLRLSDSGVYKCEWTYYTGSGWVDNHILVNLTITARERNNAWAEDPENREQRGVVGGTTTLACQAPPEQQQDVDFEWWFKNETNVIIDYTNDVIDNEGNERVKFTGDLTKGDASITIEDLRLNDSGVYKCEWTYYSGSGLVDNHILVNLTITETTAPLTPSEPQTSSPPPASASRQKSSSHIVAAVVVPLVIIGAVVAGTLVYFRKTNRCCWRRNNEENTGRKDAEVVPLKDMQSNDGKIDGQNGENDELLTSPASDIVESNIDPP